LRSRLETIYPIQIYIAYTKRIIFANLSLQDKIEGVQELLNGIALSAPYPDGGTTRNLAGWGDVIDQAMRYSRHRTEHLPTGFAHDEGTDLTLSRSRFYQIERRGTSW
jgi:hypothetical protein